MQASAKIRRIRFFLCFMVLTAFLPSFCLAAPPADPTADIKGTVDEVLRILQDKALAAPALKTERKARLVSVIEKKFDFREMAMRTLGRQWREQSATDQSRFAGLFKKLLENTYINKIETYSGEKVVFKKHQREGEKAVVYTELVRNKVETPVNYKLQAEGDQWMVYDVEIEGVSLVNNYRTQFASILNKEKFAGLLTRIEEKVNKGKVE